MAKDPAFLFYPGDWLSGTMGMTFEEKGAYMELLVAQFNRGHMTEHMIGHMIGQLWVKIQDKFVKDSLGLWYNTRLDQEKNKRKAFTDSRKNNREGKNQYSKKRGHMTYHMENENIVNTVESTKGRRGVTFSEDQTEVIFKDGTSQKLGEGQILDLKRGNLSPGGLLKGFSPY